MDVAHFAYGVSFTGPENSIHNMVVKKPITTWSLEISFT